MMFSTSVRPQLEEDKHWWFASRSRALLGILDQHVRPDNLDVLDVGCGAGNMIHHLSRYGRVKGVEIDARPVQRALARGYDVQQADATQGLPFDDGEFDLVTALDVIEHNEDDVSILREMRRVLKPGGHAAITVPAFQWLWSHNDVLNAHVRRYTAPGLREKLHQVGLRVARMTYNNFFVFPLAAALILARRGADQKPVLRSHHFDTEEYQVEMEPAPPLVNSILTGVGWVEAEVLRVIDLPVGTSIICVARKLEQL